MNETHHAHNINESQTKSVIVPEAYTEKPPEVEPFDREKFELLAKTITDTTNSFKWRRLNSETEREAFLDTAKEVLDSETILEQALHTPETAHQAIVAIKRLRAVRKQEFADSYRALCYKLVRNNLPLIESQINKDDLEKAFEGLDLIATPLSSSSNEPDALDLKETARTTLTRHLPTIKQGFVDPNLSFRYQHLLKHIYDSDNFEVLDNVLSFLIDTYTVDKGFAQRESFRQIVSLRLHPMTAIHEKAQQFIDNFFSSCNLPAHSFFDAWKMGGADEDAIELNLLTMLDLEKEEPGITRALAQRYNIANFGRYPAEILLSQYRHIEDNDLPYGIILYPYADHNGAFYQNSDTFRKLNSQLVGRYYIRIAEGETKQQIARTLIELDRMYGDKRKIAFAILGGHGTEETIHFGESDEPRNFLSIDDLAGKGLQRTTKFFTERPTIMLVSCSTGTPEGIGQNLSRTLNARVIAPEIPTNVKSITVTVDKDNSLIFDVKYNDEDTERSYVSGLSM